jgi:hypothetical protein
MSVLDNYIVVATDDGASKIPFELRGPRGARYGLMRNALNPDHLFAVNLRTFGVVDRLGWFREADVKAKMEAQTDGR